ncbi:PDF receptor-like [Limulus polyphemus]|uniref:PDF receptor-like n=1 Tax=Limulus polyphemus TaxID=6850 RepID=A0ABM1THE5_LIMPO|nr:PDF receptor-like [Limulus polyphemus]
MEMTGLLISLVALLVSILIFARFRSLRNRRNAIHKYLFLAMSTQVLVRLVLYIDQWISRGSPVLCESFYVLLEYTRTAVFTWMLLEGVQIHAHIIVVFPDNIKFRVYHAIGWGIPLILVGTWTAVMATFHSETVCWWGYPFNSYFWILEGPRIFCILVNLIILLNVVCIIFMKVHNNNNTEIQKIKVAVRAALFLLPLLGITSILQVIPAPLDKSPFEFGMWAYSTHLLSSTQGFVLALLYCFINQEVKTAVVKRWRSFKLTHSWPGERGGNQSDEQQLPEVRVV